jgi:hypothetical protein
MRTFLDRGACGARRRDPRIPGGRRRSRANRAVEFPLPALGPVLKKIQRELLEGRGFAMLRGLPVGSYSREDQAIAYLGIGSYLGAARSQNAKGHLLGHVKDLGLDIGDRTCATTRRAASSNITPTRSMSSGCFASTRRNRAARASSRAR